ncbi:hypothetical protein L1887_34090 [Cichorium endivia]|nr:hypothetical protein L1887_34090 [Cichorium endivia]
MSAGEEDSDFLATQRYAIVTGSNKGIGLEVCKQPASKGNIVNNAAVLGVNVDFHALEASKDDKVEEGAQSITRLVLLPMYGQGQSGLFFYRDEMSSF